MKIPRWLAFISLIAMLLTACGAEIQTPEQPAAETPTTQPIEEATPEEVTQPTEEAPIYLSIIWHQHQPVYYKDPETDIYSKPWVRMHAAKDYVDMATILNNYPDVHVTFNLTPSLIRQLEDLMNGAKDEYWVHTEIDAQDLSEEEKRFILRYFFDINTKIIERFPRYVELQAMRPGNEEETTAALESWTEQDFRDLQMLFNLGWTDPDFLAETPLSTLVEKGRDFSEEDKQIILDEHLRYINSVIPVHKALQDAKQIEVTMTPYAHPILPLLVDSNLAKVAMPSAEIPAPPYRYGKDAIAQLQKGVALYKSHFAVAPRGMWPAEGSVAQEIVNMVSKEGIQWMASDEGVLAKSLGMDSFERDTHDTVQDANALYRPYTVAGADGVPVTMVFRDVVISNKVGFTYSGVSGTAAAEDFINRIHTIHEQLKAEGAEGPNLVTVILDGENAWEHYENDGKEFLHTLYQMLAEDETIVTLTPSEYLAKFPEEPSRQIDDLWPGSWISHDYSTWIGEDEENRAWNYLREVRETVQKYESGMRTPPSEESLAEALDLMYIAEGSDWFWWYGSDQNSGDDEGFDRQFRDTLKQVLTSLDEEVPDWLSVPIIAESPEPAEQSATGLITPTIDGIGEDAEWQSAGYYSARAGAMAATTMPVERLYYGFDAKTLYLRIDGSDTWTNLTSGGEDVVIGIYALLPGGGEASAFSRYGDADTYLGFGATQLIEMKLGAYGAGIQSLDTSFFNGEEWKAVENVIVRGVNGNTVEMGIPLEILSPEGAALDSGDRIQLRMVLSQGSDDEMTDEMLLPQSGPALIVVPDLGLTTQVLEVNDLEDDDYAGGSYTYPTDAVFQPGAFDAKTFSVGYDENNIVFRITLGGPLENVWDSPNGVSIQTIDIYIDQDGADTGERLLLPGRNAALTADYAWDYAIWVEGWTPGLYVPGDEAPVQIDTEMTIIADPGQSKITVKIPRESLGDNPEAWSYAAVILGQEGYPAAGVWRVRDVSPKAQQWRFGGSAEDASHTRIIDVIWPTEGEQETALSTYTSADDLKGLGADDFAQLGMIRAGE